jgi:hypothetical protein
MLKLAFSQRGLFIRAAVYSLPRWMGTSVASWLMIFAVILLPFLAAIAVLPLWMKVAAQPNSWGVGILRGIGMVVVSLLAVAFWAMRLKAQAIPVMKAVPIIGLVATVWCFLIVPFLYHPPSDAGAWLNTAWQYLVSGNSSGMTWPVAIGLVLVGLIVVLITCSALGTWLMVYPLATGVATFFVLREASEGTRYQTAAGATQGAGSQFAMPGAFLFRSGSVSALSALKPPRGWLALCWLPVMPRTLVPAMLAGMFMIVLCLLVSDKAEWWRPASYGGAIVFFMVVFLPHLCRSVARKLAPTKKALVTDAMLPIRVGGAWLWLLLNSGLVVAAIGLGGSLGIIPVIGPVVWGVTYLFMLFGASVLISSLMRWVPGSMIVSAVAACDLPPAARAADGLRQTDYYSGAAPWTFLGAMLVGLPCALMPAAVVAIAGYLGCCHLLPTLGNQIHDLVNSLAGLTPHGAHLGGASFGGALVALGGIAGLILSGVAASLTNAYLIVRQTVGDRTLQLGQIVILGRHQNVNGEDNWHPDMEAFVGKRARITAFVGRDSSGCEVIRVDVDSSRFVWRTINVVPV